ncbi:hypothetical protein [Streptomyces griseus]|uniref:hypothetical protein n=1 Tax=Streptomyces griseus TaxID=1911 RepID=UPI00055BD3F9|nr:hypothetical protein [Streptomyces griseus]
MTAPTERAWEGSDDTYEGGTSEGGEWNGDGGPGHAESSATAPRHLAGWLFADLFLVLFVLVLGLLPPAPREKEEPPVRPTGQASTPAPGRPAGKVVAGGIDPKYHTVGVALSARSTVSAGQRKGLTSADAAKVTAAVAREVARSGKGRKVGMLITFGGAPHFEENARTLARHTNKALLAKAPKLFCGRNVGTRPFWDGDPLSDGRRHYDAVRIDVYYTNSCKEH